MRKIKIVELINGLDLEGVSARLADDDFILSVEGELEERFSSIERMSEVLNSRSRTQDSDRLDEVDQAICLAYREQVESLKEIASRQQG